MTEDKAFSSAGKLSRYFFYATGEIILVVVGILLALQVNNWNEKSKNEAEFKAVLQQIYTVIDQDAEKLLGIVLGLEKQIKLIDSLSQTPKSINPKLLPHLLFYIDLQPSDFTSEVSYLLDKLSFNAENVKQSSLNKMLYSYGNALTQKFNETPNYMAPFLEGANMSNPSVNFGYSILNDYQNIDTSFFSDLEIEQAIELLELPSFKNALKSSRSRKALNTIFVNDLINLANTNQAMIRAYYPEVRLLYANIGIVGDATENHNWVNNIPLTLTNERESIWEADLLLSDGFVKFREGENWNFNWGGEDFPAGSSISYGNNIKVSAGNYHIIFNLSDKTYTFIKQNN